LTALVSILLFSLLQQENFLWGFQIQFVGVFAASTAALISIACSAAVKKQNIPHNGLRSILWLMLSMIFYIVSVLMMSNGLFTGIILLILAFWLRIPRIHFTVIVIVFLVSVCIYLYDYHTPKHHAQPLESVMQIGDVLLYSITYLGGPFGSILADMFQYFQLRYIDVNVITAQAAGLLGLVISVVLGIFVVSQGRDQACRAEAVLLMVMAMVVGTAFMTALGRLNLPYSQALASRYMTPTLVFWSAVGVLGCVIANRLRPKYGRGLSVISAILLVGLSAFIVMHQAFVFRGGTQERLVRDQAGIAMIIGAKDDEALRLIYPHTSVPWDARDFLHRNRLSIYAEPFAEWYGINIHTQFDLARPNRCQGFFDSINSIVSFGSAISQNQSRVTGWAWDNEKASVPQTIIITDEQGVIVGLGLTGYQRQDVSNALPTITTIHTGWKGYVNGLTGSSLTAYAVLEGGEMVCRLGREHVVPQPLISIDQVKKTVIMPSVEAKFDGMWQVDGDDHIKVPRPNLDGVIYGSWVGQDSNVGHITLAGLSVPPSRRIVIPFVMGPSPSNLFITIHDPSGREIMRFQPEATMNWVALIVELQLDIGTTFDLIVEDSGRNWGQWMAIGTPRAVQVQ
jgi:hypothetical protein